MASSSRNCSDFLPTDWFSFAAQLGKIPEAYLVCNASNIWPWTKISKNDYFIFFHRLDMRAYFSVTPIVEEIFYSLGFLGNLLIILTLIKKNKLKVFNAFDAILLLIASLDFIFLLLKEIRTRLLDAMPTDKIAQQIFSYGSGIAYTCSLWSDLLTLALTIERYIALSAPLFHYGISNKKKNRIWIIVVLLAFLISCTRLHYVVETIQVSDTTVASNLWFRIIAHFSDNAIPFILTGAMLILVIGISRAIFIRHRQQKNLTAANQAKERRAVTAALKSVSLLIVLMSMFLINQIGYVLYSLSTLLKPQLILIYSSSYEEVQSYLNYALFFYNAAYLSGPMEVISRSFVFYAYLLCNGSFRRDLKNTMMCRGSSIETQGSVLPLSVELSQSNQKRNNSVDKA